MSGHSGDHPSKIDSFFGWLYPRIFRALNFETAQYEYGARIFRCLTAQDSIIDRTHLSTEMDSWYLRAWRLGSNRKSKNPVGGVGGRVMFQIRKQ